MKMNVAAAILHLSCDAAAEQKNESKMHGLRM